MEMSKILLYQEEGQGTERIDSVSALIRCTRAFEHAGEKELEFILNNPDFLPEELINKRTSSPLKASLFCGTIHTDDNGKEYVMALYNCPKKGLVTERYWLADPVSEDFYLAFLP